MPLSQEFPVWLDKFFAFAFKSFFNNKNVIQLNCKIYRKLLKGLKMVKLVLQHKLKEANQRYSHSYVYDLFPGLQNAPPIILAPLPTV